MRYPPGSAGLLTMSEPPLRFLSPHRMAAFVFTQPHEDVRTNITECSDGPQHVTDAPNRHEVPGTPWIRLELAPDVLHVDVAGALIGRAGAAGQPRSELLARKG